MNGRRKVHLVALVVAVVAVGFALVPFGYDRFQGRVECGSPIAAAFKNPSDAVEDPSLTKPGPQLLDPSFGYTCVNQARGRLVGAGGILLLAGIGVSVGHRVVRARVRAALIAAACGAVLVFGGVRFAGDHDSGLRDCRSRGPTGSTPCLHRCVHSSPLFAGPEAANARCVYDPTGEIFPTTTTVAGTPLPPGAVTPAPITTD